MSLFLKFLLFLFNITKKALTVKFNIFLWWIILLIFIKFVICFLEYWTFIIGHYLLISFFEDTSCKLYIQSVINSSSYVFLSFALFFFRSLIFHAIVSVFRSMCFIVEAIFIFNFWAIQIIDFFFVLDIIDLDAFSF